MGPQLEVDAGEGINDQLGEVELSPGQNLPGTRFSLARFARYYSQPIKRSQRVRMPLFCCHTETWEDVVSQRLHLHPENIRSWRLADEAMGKREGPITAR